MSRTRSSHSAEKFVRVHLQIEVIKATGLPEGGFLSGCNPYVCVHVVDGNPLSAEAESVGEAWYSERQQFQAKTSTIEGTSDPEWHANFRAEVQVQECSFLHFQICYRSLIALADRKVGQAAVPLEEVLKDAWVAPRALTLAPFQRADQQEWANLTGARLFVRASWEGKKARSQSHLQGFGERGYGPRPVLSRKRNTSKRCVPESDLVVPTASTPAPQSSTTSQTDATSRQEQTFPSSNETSADACAVS